LIGWIGRPLGGKITGKTATELLTLGPNSPLATAASLIPAGVILLGVTTQVTEAITGAASYNVGDGAMPDIYGGAIATVLGTTSKLADHTSDPLRWMPASEDVEIGAVGGNFTGGKLLITVHYLELL